MRGLWKLAWLEIKIFVREPLGLIGSVGIPVLVFIMAARMFGSRLPGGPRTISVGNAGLPVLAALLISLSAVVSLVTIVSIYREGGILKRLRATPLRPQTILTAHVIVKLLFTAFTVVLMMLAGRRYYPFAADLRTASFVVALVVATCSILSIGFLIASIVPTARFAQPIASLILYPMIALSGLFFPLAILPPAVQALAYAQPLPYAVSLLDGILNGEAWLAHAGDVAGLVAIFGICTALSAKVFRWE